MTAIDTMAGRLAQIRLRIAHACQRAGRDPLDVTLLPVSKTSASTPSAKPWRWA